MYHQKLIKWLSSIEGVDSYSLHWFFFSFFGNLSLFSKWLIGGHLTISSGQQEYNRTMQWLFVTFPLTLVICESLQWECCRFLAIIVQIKWKQMGNPENSLQTLILALVKAVPVKVSKCFKFLFSSVLDRWKLLTEKANIDNLGFCPAVWGCKESRCSPP